MDLPELRKMEWCYSSNLFNEHLLNTYSGSGPLLGSGDTKMKELPSLGNPGEKRSKEIIIKPLDKYYYEDMQRFLLSALGVWALVTSWLDGGSSIRRSGGLSTLDLTSASSQTLVFSNDFTLTKSIFYYVNSNDIFCRGLLNHFFPLK